MKMERKSHVLHTERFVCMKNSGVGLPRMARYVSQTLQPFNCCSRNLFTYSCSTVSTTHTRSVDPSALNCIICKQISPSLHCRILPLKVQFKKKHNSMSCDYSNLLWYILYSLVIIPHQESQGKARQSIHHGRILTEAIAVWILFSRSSLEWIYHVHCCNRALCPPQNDFIWNLI